MKATQKEKQLYPYQRRGETRLGIDLDRKIHKQLKKIAAENHVSLTTIIKRSLDAYLSRYVETNGKEW